MDNHKGRRRGPLPGAPGAGRPPLPPEVRASILAAISAPGATVGGVARATGRDRKTVRAVRDEAGVLPAKKGRRKVVKEES